MFLHTAGLEFPLGMQTAVQVRVWGRRKGLLNLLILNNLLSGGNASSVGSSKRDAEKIRPENQLRRDSLLGKLTALGTEMHRALEGPRGSCAAITGGSTAAKVMEMWTKRRSGEF